MSLHPTTFGYLMPTEAQKEAMTDSRSSFAECAERVGMILPEGPDKDHVMRLLRDAAMWANVAITREADGAPRP